MEASLYSRLAGSSVLGALALLVAGCPGAEQASQGGSGGGDPNNFVPTGPVFGAGGTAGVAPPVAGAGGTGGGIAPPTQTTTTGIPCAHAQVIADNCLNCHGSPTNWGAPMPLVTHADFHATSKTDPSRPVYQVVAERIADPNRPMPPTGLMEPSVMDGLRQWLASGAPIDPTATCTVTMPPVEEEPIDEPPVMFENETCHQLWNHGQSGNKNDPSKYTVAADETYVNFYHDVPWTEPVVLTRWKTLYDNTQILHHWLLYKTNSTKAGGSFNTSIGSHLDEDTELVAGWAVGGNDVQMPPGITARLPPPGGKLMLEWHFYNQTPSPIQDRSGVEICTVPQSQVDPAKIGGITWLGTEYFNGPFGMPAGVESKFSGTCRPSWNNAPEGTPITIYAFQPHMHQLGKHMESYVTRANGTKEMVFSKPFQFDNQISYDMDPYIILNRGDTITSTCTFFNNTNASVAFGPSSDQEMCYQFAFSYPAGALDNGVASLVGATNTCW